MDANDEVRLGLELGLGLAEYTPTRENPRKNKRLFLLDLSFPHHNNDYSGISADSSSSLKIVEENEGRGGCNNSNFYGDKEEEDDNNFSKDFGRKKLRLTRDQTTFLEESFKQQPTLNMAQKQLLAERLNLKPRQVEVWFQNRRARTKLKQTEVDCEFLKKNCERLLEENRRLKKEVSELRSSLDIEKPQPPPSTPPRGAAAQPLPSFFHQNRKASADRMAKVRGGGEKQEAAEAALMRGVVQEP